MNLELQDKVAFVAGSSRGIGLAIARGFLNEGARVVITGRDDKSLSAAAETLIQWRTKLLTIKCDLLREDEIQRALTCAREAFGGIDFLIANIGSGRGEAGNTPDPLEWQRLMDINLNASVRMITAVLPSMIQSKSGAIVIVNSIAGMEASPAPLPYSAAKAALWNYAKNLSRLVALDGIRINSVAPGNVLFPGGSWEKHLENRKDEVVKYIEREVPMKRFGSTDEIADAVMFLSSPRASFITGACLVADGGQNRAQ
jgi:3-oxoacyl-[acyl-carrier protein] reductase